MNLKSLSRISALHPHPKIISFMPSSLIIEAWIAPLPTITPSLIVHNLELQGLQLPQPFTVTIDRGHYDCADCNYAVITVLATSAAASSASASATTASPFSFCCSFFSQKAVRGMDPIALHSHWLGNCYVHVGATDAVCSYRHEPGRAKTWRKSQDQCQPQQDQQPDQEDAVSVDPVCPSPKKNTKTKDPKDHVRIIQLQKKNLVLRTELDALKSEVKALAADHVALAADHVALAAEHVALAQRHKEQEAGTKRANKCMQDWTNQQIIERIRILETQQQPNKCKKCKAQKKEIKQLSERLVLLENVNANATTQCNKCSWNPFDFNTIYDPWEKEDMPALDLIVNHYPDYVQPDVIEDVVEDVVEDVIEDEDDDMFEVVQIFDFPPAK